MSTSQRGRVRIEQSPKRVRVLFGGTYVADGSPLLVWEKPYYPTYYFPSAAVRTDLLVPTGEVDHSPSRGDAEVHSLKVDDRQVEDAVIWYREAKLDGIVDHVRFDWNAVDAWFEEDEQVYVHPRDPFTRIDILASSRQVRVEIDGVTVAESDHPTLLFETGLPTRYYLPKTDVRWDLLTPTDHHTECPYKGTASYYSVEVDGTVHDDAVWWYPFPTRESLPITGLVSFYNEKVDLWVDGELQERPKSPFS